MRFFKYLLLALTVTFSFVLTESYAGTFSMAGYSNTDLFGLASDENRQVSAYYDLRDRETYIQVTNLSSSTRTIHVQIFQHDRNCDELNFFDDLTSNDTVVYNLDNIIKNDGSEAPISLNEDSYGYVVISTDPLSGPSIIGNFRIIDNTGYEYRSNMVSPTNDNGGSDNANVQIGTGNLIANFNTIDGANWSDLVGYAYQGERTSTVTNIDEGFSFDIFVFDMDEEPLSCDRRNFACGNVMNYGINEDYPNSRDGLLICPGGGLANPQGGFVSFENPSNDNIDPNDDMFVGFIGINNSNGTGSLDHWFYRDGFVEED